MDEKSVQAAVEEARGLVRSDGADLLLVKADPGMARIDLRLDVTNLNCDAEDGACLVPPPMLFKLVEATFQRHIAGEFELRIDDPR